MFDSWTKLNRSFSGCFGWLRIRQSRPRKHLAQNVATLETAVVTKSELVDVILQILPADAVMRSIQRAFKLRPKSFNRVRVNTANGIFPRAVIHADVLESEFGSEVIDRRFVADNLRRRLNIFAEMPNGISRRGVGDDGCADFPAPLDKSDDWNFPNRSASKTFALPADIGFVCLNNSSEQISPAGHEAADLMPHAMRGFIGHAKLTFQFFRGNSVLGFCEQENCEEPRFERSLALVENRASSRVNLCATKRAREGAAFLAPMEAISFATFANVICESRFENKFQTGRVVGELRVKIFEIIAHFSKVKTSAMRLVSSPSAPQSSGEAFASRPFPLALERGEILIGVQT